MDHRSEHIARLQQLIMEAELREPHSAAYEQGLRKAVALRLTGSTYESPFAPGTLEHDAFTAGAKHGLLWTPRYVHRYSRDSGIFLGIYTDPKMLANRLARGRALASRIIQALQAEGMGEAQLIGSMASGKIHESSDVDILVFDCGSLKPFYIIGEMVEGYTGREIGDEDIKVDCIVPAILAERERERWMAMRDSPTDSDNDES